MGGLGVLKEARADAAVSLSSNPSILIAFVAGHLMGGSV